MSLAVLISTLTVAASLGPSHDVAPAQPSPTPMTRADLQPQPQAGDLPPDELVRQALDQHPSVGAAKARLDAAVAEAEALRRGSYEVTLEGAVAQRDIRGEAEFEEFEGGVSRTFRLPGKATLDRRAGELGVEIARRRLQQARLDAGLTLADLWYDWLRTAELRRNAFALVQTQSAVARATQRRVELRDAAELDLEQARVALAMAEAEAQNAMADNERAHSLLAGRFPDLLLPAEAPALSPPVMEPGQMQALQAEIVSRSLEIAAAASEAEREEVVARRARADRFADPSIGLRLFRERSGEERGAGVTFSIPLGGGHRRALADQATALASAALSERVLVERDVIAAVNADVAELRSRLLSWTASREAAERARRSAELSARGQALGAIDLTDLLYAESQANEARRVEIAARATARTLAAKLFVRAQILWSE